MEEQVDAKGDPGAHAAGFGHGTFPMTLDANARAEQAAVETLSSQQKDFVFEVRRGRAARSSKASMRAPAKKFVSSDLAR